MVILIFCSHLRNFCYSLYQCILPSQIVVILQRNFRMLFYKVNIRRDYKEIFKLYRTRLQLEKTQGCRNMFGKQIKVVFYFENYCYLALVIININLLNISRSLSIYYPSAQFPTGTGSKPGPSINMPTTHHNYFVRVTFLYL